MTVADVLAEVDASLASFHVNAYGMGRTMCGIRTEGSASDPNGIRYAGRVPSYNGWAPEVVMAADDPSTGLCPVCRRLRHAKIEDWKESVRAG